MIKSKPLMRNVQIIKILLHKSLKILKNIAYLSPKLVKSLIFGTNLEAILKIWMITFSEYKERTTKHFMRTNHKLQILHITL